MIKHPLNRARTPSTAFYAPVCPTSPAVTIARQADEIRELRRKLDAIEGLVNGVSFGTKSLAELLVFHHAVKSVIQERQS